MGKRKRTSSTHHNANKTPSSSDNMPCSSRAGLLSSQKSSHLLDSSELKHLSPRMDVTDNTVKLLNVHSSLAHQHDNIDRSILLKRSRHYYGHHYSRRHSGNHANASTSHGKIAPLRDERLPFKLASQSGLVFGRLAENREKAFGRPDRIRLGHSVVDACDEVKMICGICHIPGDILTLSARECSIVAVLVCGHVYHADCLEQRTSDEDRHDPPCPLCSGLLSQGNASRGQE